MTLREKYQEVIIDYSKQADFHSEEAARTGDPYHLIAYHQICATLCTLKALIKAQEETANM